MRVSRKAKFGILLLASLMAAGCTTVDPYTGESKTSNATKGAAIGAGAGAVLGAITATDGKDRGKRALAGAALGGLVGLGTGAYMDKQEAELRKELRGTGVSVTRHGDNITLNMPGNITFRSGSADLQAHSFDVLNSVGIVLKKYDETKVEISGHTDNTGSDARNSALSQERANTVAHYLMGRGLTHERTTAVGYGKTRPIASNATEAGRASNRRVEILLLPAQQS